MTDFILQFTDEASAQAALPQIYNNGAWDESVCIPGLVVNKQTGIDADGNPIVETATGWFIRTIADYGQTPFDPTGWDCSPVFSKGL